MNRKQKKAKRLIAKAHTEKQAKIYLTPKEKQDIADWNSFDELELLAVEEDCQRFRNTVSTVLYLVPIFFMAYVVWCNW